MVNKFWIIIVLIMCVFIVFLLAPLGEEEAKSAQTTDEHFISPSAINQQ